MRVIGVNAGYAFSFVRDLAEEIRWAAVPAEGSQFRSRDLFPQAAAAIALGQPDAGEKVRRADVPAVPANRIAYIDGYGNLKTTIPSGFDLPPSGSTVRVRIGSTEEREAVVSDGTFAVKPGQLAFAPGSSGWPNADGEETRFMELFLRGGNAAELFDHPPIAAQIRIKGE